MDKSYLLGVVYAVLSILASAEVNAALTGVLPATPGGTDYQAYYDDVTDLTWMADAGAAGNTKVNLHTARAWAASLNINGVTGWRLPYTNPVDGTTANDAGFSYDGSGDRGYNISAPGTLYAGSQASEMAYLFHNTLGNKSKCDPVMSTLPNNCVIQPGWGLVNSGPFQNIQNYYYWSDTPYALDPIRAWGFHFTADAGRQGTDNSTGGTRWVWAVHDGDVSALPTTPVDISGTIKTAGGQDICAMVLASGQYMFSCNPTGVFSLTNLPRETNGTIKRQIYADGFFPKIDTLAGSSLNEAVVMTSSGTCPSYNTPYSAGVYPSSAGARVVISGTVLVQDTQTPICAMVLANGEHMFSCDGTGSYSLNIPLDSNGQYKLQVYAQGFAPTIQRFDEFSTNNTVKMALALECQ